MLKMQKIWVARGVAFEGGGGFCQKLKKSDGEWIGNAVGEYSIAFYGSEV